MSGIGANLGNSEILNIEHVKKENVPKTVDNMKKLAEVDCNHNVILVKEEGNDAIVANVKLDSSLNLSSVALEKEGKLGNFIGEIKFFDNGDDDKLALELKKTEALQLKPSNLASETSNTVETKPVKTSVQENAGGEENIYKLSLDQAYKYLSTMSIIFYAYDEPERLEGDMKDIKKDLTSREKAEKIKYAQEYGNDGKQGDGKWGISTFATVKERYDDRFNKETTDKEFRKLIDDVVKFYDGGISYEALNKKHHFGPQVKK